MSKRLFFMSEGAFVVLCGPASGTAVVASQVLASKKHATDMRTLLEEIFVDQLDGDGSLCYIDPGPLGALERGLEKYQQRESAEQKKLAKSPKRKREVIREFEINRTNGSRDYSRESSVLSAAGTGPWIVTGHVSEDSYYAARTQHTTREAAEEERRKFEQQQTDFYRPIPVHLRTEQLFSFRVAQLGSLETAIRARLDDWTARLAKITETENPIL